MPMCSFLTPQKPANYHQILFQGCLTKLCQNIQILVNTGHQ